MRDILTIFGISIGTSLVVGCALLRYLGTVWRERIAREEKAKLESQLTEFKIELERNSRAHLRQLQYDSQVYLQQIQKDLAILKERQQRGLNDKLEIYRIVANITSDALADIDFRKRDPSGIPKEPISS
jgi:hypothetical protein